MEMASNTAVIILTILIIYAFFKVEKSEVPTEESRQRDKERHLCNLRAQRNAGMYYSDYSELENE